MPLGFSSGRPFTPLSVATSAFSPATACFRASFSASSRSAKASSSPRGRLERGIFAGADMPGTGRVRASPAQPRQLTSARPFAPRTIGTSRSPSSAPWLYERVRVIPIDAAFLADLRPLAPGSDILVPAVLLDLYPKAIGINPEVMLQ